MATWRLSFPESNPYVLLLRMTGSSGFPSPNGCTAPMDSSSCTMPSIMLASCSGFSAVRLRDSLGSVSTRRFHPTRVKTAILRIAEKPAVLLLYDLGGEASADMESQGQRRGLIERSAGRPASKAPVVRRLSGAA